jgi:hypothetical protein
VPWQHVADAGDATVFAADHGEPLQRKGRPGAVSQQVLKRLTIDTQLVTKERDPDAGVHREPAVLSAAVAGGTDAATLAREGDDKTPPARSAACPAESEAEDATGEV